jgi:DNA-binding Lrp family transcriptional regulator
MFEDNIAPTAHPGSPCETISALNSKMAFEPTLPSLSAQAHNAFVWLKRFASTVSVMPEVMEFYRMAGDVDCMMHVVIPDMPSYTCSTRS